MTLTPLGCERALPSYYEATRPYFKYEVLLPITDVTQSKILPWFGQPGRGVQFKLPESIEFYLNNGHLRKMPK
jgi:filamentous hemagglutinin